MLGWLLPDAGLRLAAEHVDAGGNPYYKAVKPGG
jgi:hypothetical protein